MALNVLLVDDEYIVLKGLEIILKEQTAVELKLLTAMDAADALDRLSEFRPDVVIADINMPEKDGFTMIEEIRTLYPECQFIICSGYDELDYLKQALKLHVAEYLLKPVDKTVLIHRLKELAQEKENRIAHTLLRIQILLFKGQSAPEVSFPVEELERIFPYNSFCLCTVDTTAADILAIKGQLIQYFNIVYVFTLNSRVVYILNYPNKIQTKEIYSMLTHILNDIIWGCSFFSADADKTFAIRSIPIHYQEALSEMTLSLLHEESNRKNVILSSIRTRTLLPAIRVLTFEDSIDEYIQELYDTSLKDTCYLLAFTEIFSAYMLISDISIPPELILHSYQMQSNAAFTPKTLVHFVKKTLNFWYDSFSQTEHANCSSKIASACRYIDLHYQEDLSLDQLADMLTINPSYLSYIFKKETGSTLVQYLTNTRMQQACQLLSSRSKLSLEEIAVRTGFHSTTYFHKIFRSYYGVSPRQWQLANSKSE